MLWPFKNKEPVILSHRSDAVTLLTKYLDIKADSTRCFWQQKVYHDLLLSPDSGYDYYDIAKLITKVKIKHRYKGQKTRRLAKLILHGRRAEWKLYRIRIYDEHRIILKYFNYQDENRLKVTIDISNLNRAKLRVEGFDNGETYVIDWICNSDVCALTVYEKSSDYERREYTFEDDEINYVYIHSNSAGDR